MDTGTTRVQPPVWHWMLAMGLMGGSFLLGWIHLRADAVVRIPQPTPVPPLRVVDVGEAAHTDWWDQAQTWLPTLFALPGPGGFGESIRNREIAVLPPVDQPLPITMKLDHRSTDAAAASRVFSRNAESLSERVERWGPSLPPPPRLRDRTARPVATGLPTLTRIESSPPRMLEHTAWPESPTGWGDESWAAEGVLYVTAEGIVTHALLDMQPEISRRSEQILRAFHQWRWHPTSTSSVVRVEIHFAADEASGGTVDHD